MDEYGFVIRLAKTCARCAFLEIVENEEEKTINYSCKALDHEFESLDDTFKKVCGYFC
jgi:hypothetical protein